MLRFPVFFLSVLLVNTVFAGSQQSSYWLDKMMKAVHQLNYDGHFVYLHGDNIESLRTVHTVIDGHEIERLFSLNGEAREIVRDKDTVTRIMPNDKSVATTKRLMDTEYFSGFFVLQVEEIEKNYEINLSGRDRIADRATLVMVFKPRDDLRYGYRLNLDEEYALPLQWEMFDQQGSLISSIMFTQISIGDEVADSGSLLEKDNSPVTKHVTKQVTPSTQELNNSPPKSAWHFDNIPNGFKLKHHRPTIPHHPKRDIEQYIFSDGIASFSVYIEQTDKSRLSGQAHLGALNAYGVFVDGHQITAVGEVPSETLVFISNLAKK